MARSTSISVGIIVERRSIDHKWATHCWRPAAVMVPAPPIDGWRHLFSADGRDHYHAANLMLELFARHTEDYKVALSSEPPVVYVVLRPTEGEADALHEVRPFKVTASPYEAQDYLDAGSDIVEAVAMPAALADFVQDFVAGNHVDAPFQKRERAPHSADSDPFAPRPLVAPGRGRRHGR